METRAKTKTINKNKSGYHSACSEEEFDQIIRKMEGDCLDNIVGPQSTTYNVVGAQSTEQTASNTDKFDELDEEIRRL